MSVYREMDAPQICCLLSSNNDWSLAYDKYIRNDDMYGTVSTTARGNDIFLLQ